MISRPVKRFLYLQLVVLGSLALVAVLALERDAAWSVVIGALIGFLALCYMTLQTFRIDAALTPHLALGAFYRGVAGRIALVTVLFAAAFYSLPWLKAPSLFLGFGVILVTQLIGSARLATELTRNNRTSREC